MRDASHITRFGLPEGPRYRALPEAARGAASPVGIALRLARRRRGLVLAVPGDPLTDDALAIDLRERARRRGIPVRVVPGLCLTMVALEAAGIEPAPGVQVAPASAVAASLSLIQPQRPLAVTALEASTAGPALEALRRIYPPAAECVVVSFGPAVLPKRAPLAEVALADGPAVLLAPALAPVNDLRTFAGLRWVVGQLRRKCPWDRQQTHASLKGYLLEETYETLAALDENHVQALSEELGDLLLQILLHVEIAEGDGEFTFEDAVERIASKLIRRHPHVFGETRVESAEEVAANWELIKRRERGKEHLLDAVPLSMPALAQAQSILARAARAGFEWREAGDILQKIREELRELAETRSPAERLVEFGDLLFALTSLARRLDVDAEEALRLATRKFRERFARMEALASERGRMLDSLSLSELIGLWNEVKGAV